MADCQEDKVTTEMKFEVEGRMLCIKVVKMQD